MVKKVISYLLFSLFILSASWNVYYSFISFVSSNLTIRESFYFENNVLKKGTHWGGENYYLKSRGHKFELVKLRFSSIINSFSKLSNIDPFNSEFNNEYQLISLLYEIEKMPISRKRETALYIPKTLDVYWNLSCDSHMVPFVAPAITNMAMIEGLPMKDSSCYTHRLEYGFSTYYLLGKKAEFLEMTQEQICERAIKEGFKRVIEITKNNEGDLITITYECS